jgi:hypothetical protein
MILQKKLNSLFYVSKEHDETRFELLYSNLVQLVLNDKMNNFENFLSTNVFGTIEKGLLLEEERVTGVCMKILGYFGTLVRDIQHSNHFVLLYQQAMNRADLESSAIIKEGFLLGSIELVRSLMEDDEMEVFSYQINNDQRTLVEICYLCLSFPSHFVVGAAINLLKEMIRYAFLKKDVRSRNQHIEKIILFLQKSLLSQNEDLTIKIIDLFIDIILDNFSSSCSLNFFFWAHTNDYFLINTCLSFLVSGDRLLANRTLELVNFLTQKKLHTLLLNDVSCLYSNDLVKIESAAITIITDLCNCYYDHHLPEDESFSLSSTSISIYDVSMPFTILSSLHLHTLEGQYWIECNFHTLFQIIFQQDYHFTKRFNFGTEIHWERLKKIVGSPKMKYDILCVICNSIISFATNDSFHSILCSTKWVEFLFSQFMSLSLENILMKHTCYKMRKQALLLLTTIGNTDMGKNFLSILVVTTMADTSKKGSIFNELIYLIKTTDDTIISCLALKCLFHIFPSDIINNQVLLHQLIEILCFSLLHRSWEVRDTALNMTQSLINRFPTILITLTQTNIIKLIFQKLTDSFSFVRESTVLLLQCISLDQIGWDILIKFKEDPPFPDCCIQMLNEDKNEIVRKKVLLLFMSWLRLFGNQYDIIKLINIHHILEDEDWEVRATACSLIELIAISFSSFEESYLLYQELSILLQDANREVSLVAAKSQEQILNHILTQNYSHHNLANEIEEESHKDWEDIIHSFLATSKYDPDEELGLEFQEKRQRSQHLYTGEREEGDSDEEFGVYTEQLLDCPF